VNLLVDANNLVGRFFGVGGSFAIGELIESHVSRCSDALRCTDVVIAWDDETTFRHKIFPSYKGNRKRIDGVAEAREDVKRYLIERGYYSVYSPNYEADDVLATISMRNANAGEKSIIYSGDKDLHQMLVEGLVTQLLSFKTNYGENEFKWRTYCGEHGIAEATGVLAEQWIDYRCLTGDSTDNIGGFPGIGPKRAVDVLSKWGSIDEYYRSPLNHPVQKSVSLGMTRGRDCLDLNRRLITLVCDAPIFDVEPKPNPLAQAEEYFL